MAQNRDNKKKIVRQEWVPDYRLRMLHKVWMTVFTTAKVVLGALVTVLLIGVVCCFALVGVLADYLETDILPTASLVLEDYVLDAPSYVYSVNADGQIEKLQELYASTDWKKAEQKDVPKALIHAAVAIEDKRFYEHQGVDWVTTIKAFANMFFGSETVGGSSITQQLIKNRTQQDSVTVQRKVLEFFRAALVEKNYDKDYIINEYLNSIYMGQGCRGVKSAAEAYFGKELQTLTIAECACLISITNNPSLFDPYNEKEFKYEGELMNGKQRNRHRQMLVLGEMLSQGYITREEYDAAVAQELVFKSGIEEADKWTVCSNEECGYAQVRGMFKEEGENIHCPKCNSVVEIATDGSQEVYSYFVDALLEDVAKDMAVQDGVTEWNESIWEDYMDRISRGGYHIYATIDTDVQACVDAIYKDLDEIPDTKSAQQLQSAIVVIDNSTGDIVAMAGGVGTDKVHFGLNRATQSELQSGSSIKPLSIYAPGFEQGTLTPATIIKDLPLTYDSDGPYPRNDDREYSYARTVFSGIEDSVNAVAAHTLQKIGLNYGFEFAKNTFGLSTLHEVEDLQLAALALGAQHYGIKVRDMASAFAMFQSNGVYREGRLYSKVYDSKGNLVLDNTQDSEERLSEKTVTYMNYCLKNAVEHGTGAGADFYSVDVAGKTGSTSSFRDRWFCGYTGYYTAAVWCGYDIPETIHLSGSSGNVAAKLWNKVMKAAHKGLSNKRLYDSSKLVEVQICMDSGMIATDACAGDVRGNRVQKVSVYPEDVPTASCSKHVLVDYCTACGCTANEYCLLLAERTDLVIEKKGLLKLTQKEVNEILAAKDFGLHDIYTKDNYVYLIQDNGADGSFKGFQGNINQGVTAPFMVCTQHNKAVWDAYVAMYGPTVPVLPGNPGGTIPTTNP